MRLFEDRKAGDRVAHGEHRGQSYEVIVGNDIQGTNVLGRSKTYRTLITRSEIDGQVQYACHVIVAPLFRKSRITSDRIKEAIATWKEKIEAIQDFKK